MSTEVKAKILFIEDEEQFASLIKLILEKEGYSVHAKDSLERAKSEIENLDEYDLVLSDFSLPDGDGFDVFEWVRESTVNVPFILLTAFGNVDLCKEALRRGAFDFLTKPIDKKTLLRAIERVVLSLNNQQSDYKRGVRNSYLVEDRNVQKSESSLSRLIYGESALIQKFHDDFQSAIAQVERPVIILGEPGTERTQIAYRVVDRSGESRGGIAFDLGLIHEELLETEFFGESVSFGFAPSNRPSVLELAKGTTLILSGVDKLGEGFLKRWMDVWLNPQSLLKETRIVIVAEESFVAKASRSSVWIQLLKELNPIYLKIPSWDERMPEDKERAIHALWSRFVMQQRRPELKLESDLIEDLKKVRLERNLDELEELFDLLMMRASGEFVLATDLPEKYRKDLPKPTSIPLREHVRLAKEKAERQCVEKALEETRGNVTQAAKVLGVSRRGLQILMKTHQIK